MSGNNSGRQPQGGQQPRGGPQGGRPMQGGSGGIDTATVGNIVVFGLVAFAIAGVAFGLTPFLAGFIGEDPTDRITANETQAENQLDNQSKANEYVREQLSDDNLTATQSYEQMQYQNSQVRTVIGFSPLLGFALVLFAGLVIGLRSNAPTKELAVGVAVTALVGLVVFTLLSSAIAGFQYNSMSNSDWEDEFNTNPSSWNGPGGYPASDLNASKLQQKNFTADQATVGPDNSFGGRLSSINALQISYVGLIVNSITLGIFAAMGAAGIAVGGRRFSNSI